jgi:hypothetical protein
VADLFHEKVTLYDSLRGDKPRTEVCETIARYLDSVSRERGLGPLVLAVAVADVAQQPNGTDCGLYVLRNALAALSKPNPDLSRADVLTALHRASCRSVHVVFADDLPAALQARIGVCAVFTPEDDSVPADLLAEIQDEPESDVFLVTGRPAWRQAFITILRDGRPGIYAADDRPPFHFLVVCLNWVTPLLSCCS